MSTRLATSPEVRLRRIARFLSVNGVELGEPDVQAALRKANGNATDAERLLRELAKSLHIRHPPSSSSRGRSSPLTRKERCAKACVTLSPNVDAVDILMSSLTKVSKDPTNERFRKVNVSSAGPFKDRVASVPGGVELLYSVGFEPMYGHLVLQSFDASLLEHALACLEAARTSEAYLSAKARKLSAKAADDARKEKEAAAALKRAGYLSKVPAEPAAENGGSVHSTCVLTFTVGGERIARRKFESDNTLEDVLNYVRSLVAVPVDAVLKLDNVTTAPFRHLDPEDKRCASASLYALDLWPMGTVGITVMEAAA